MHKKVEDLVNKARALASTGEPAKAALNLQLAQIEQAEETNQLLVDIKDTLERILTHARWH